MPARAWIYLALSAAGAALTWYNNWQFMQLYDGFSLPQFLTDGFANPAAASLGWDVTVGATAFLVWLWPEAKRLQMRHAWIYLVLTCGVAFACAFPLFLAMRERRLADVPGDNQK